MELIQRLNQIYNELCELEEVARDDEGNDAAAEAVSLARQQVYVALEALDTGYEDEYDDSMDGDHESALASAGMGVDESYGYYGDFEY